MQLRFAFLPCLLFAAAAATGCVGDDAPLPELETGSLSAPIQGGYLDDFDTHVVGLVRLSQGGIGGCSGTLIAPNLVLTAQHCVASISTGEQVQCNVSTFSSPYNTASFYVTTRTSFSQNPNDYRQLSNILLPPGGNDVCGYDVALLILDSNVPPEEAIPAVPRVDTKLEGGEMYYAVGYGAQYDQNNAPSGTRYRRDGLITNCVGDLCEPPQSYSVHATEWSGDTGICQGDSGGPAFDMLDRVVGVASRGLPGCDAPTYGHVEPWGSWIKEVAIQAAQLGGYEAPTWAYGYPTHPAYSVAIGQACTVPEDCGWGCHAGGYCTRPCDLAPCPEGFVCGADQVCEVPVEAPPPNEGDSDDDGGSASSGCAVSGGVAVGADPTKPIPWNPLPLLLGAALLGLRRRRD